MPTCLPHERVASRADRLRASSAGRRYTLNVFTANDLYRELLELPEQERLRLVERVIHDLADAAKSRAASRPALSGASVIGLWADEARLVDEMIDAALGERESRRLRMTLDTTLDG